MITPARAGEFHRWRRPRRSPRSSFERVNRWCR